jgi:hypothetical protein
LSLDRPIGFEQETVCLITQLVQIVGQHNVYHTTGYAALQSLRP